ncbi:hypothetical protein [Saccharibacillus kuerlensis]|uniref:Uncharacterized protein n=1 Tax=Saccharibacillus kuerlensis TaxID=459527 RepID=A0ABQ2KZJ2_9BACL|nr:hypothetical protein [Saccharibacillus kuerlensis]GGN96321.1 hypothetical protein GCM10010969_13220 [Saccharibacillus kuerlensis]
MDKKREIDLSDRGPGFENIPEGDPHYQGKDVGSFKKLTKGNMTNDESLVEDTEDSKKLDE